MHILLVGEYSLHCRKLHCKSAVVSIVSIQQLWLFWIGNILMSGQFQTCQKWAVILLLRKLASINLVLKFRARLFNLRDYPMHLECDTIYWPFTNNATWRGHNCRAEIARRFPGGYLSLQLNSVPSCWECFPVAKGQSLNWKVYRSI